MNASEVSEPTGRPTMPFDHTIVLTVLNGLGVVLGGLGNSILLVVITKNEELHDHANFFIASLSVSDLIICCIYQPAAIHSFYKFYSSIVDREAGNFIALFSITASLFNLLALTTGRYISIIYPLKYLHIVTPDRVKVAAVLVWLVAIAVGTLSAVQLHLGTTVLRFFMIVVIALMLVMYVRVYFIVRSQRRKVQVHTHSFNVIEAEADSTEVRRKVEVKKCNTLVVLLAAFCITWLPFTVYSLSIDFYKENENRINYVVFHYLLTLMLFNATLDPYIYYFLDKKFRRKVKLLYQR